MVERLFSQSAERSDAEMALAAEPEFRRGREAAALLLFAAALYVTCALLSLRASPHDPTLRGSDWMGPVGASMAEILVRGFGVVAWLFPIELFLFGIPLLRGHRAPWFSLRLAGDLLVAIVLSALVQVSVPARVAFGAMPVAGNVGLFFGELLAALFSTLGSYLVGVTLIALILIGRSSFSFIEFCHCLASVLQRTGAHSGSLARRLYAAWEEARRLKEERRQEEREREQPRIETRPSDEAILAQLDDSSEWIPIEQTGSPPLAISAALRQQMPVALEEETPSAAPARARSAKSSRAVAGTQDRSIERGGGERAEEGAELEEDSKADEEEEFESSDQEAEADEASEAEDADGASDDQAPKRAGEVGARRRKTQSKGPTIVDTRHHREVKRAEPASNPKKSAAFGFKLPSTDLLAASPPAVSSVDRARVLELAERLEKTLADYGVLGKVEEIHPGPTVTTYEFSPLAGTKVSKVTSLADDLALGLSRKVRIIAPIPGKNRIGFELPNDERTPVNLREVIEDKRFEKLAERAPLPVVLGRDIVGAPFYADLASMPHVIVAGATGAGKSVGLNVMLSSLLFRRTPDELRLLMIDPKVVELAPFDGIPHMLLPVVTDMKQAATALKWAVDEMERRYQAFASAGTKNITTFNNWVERIERGEIAPPAPNVVEAIGADGVPVSVPAARAGSDGVELPGRMPYIVIVVDEFADLMMQQGKEVEACVARLAQKARAAGMHVVLATQRPSVDVITGMIKANFPTRIAFRVAQKVDSRTILDEQGAELLLGRGDMLVKMNGAGETRRVQCPFVSEEEVNALTDYLRTQGTPVYHENILIANEEENDDAEDEPLDPRFDEAVRIVADTQRCSTSWLQRKMTIGYNRAAKIVEMMERKGIVGPPNGAKDREILISPH